MRASVIASRVISSHEDDFFQIHVDDVVSGVWVCRLKLTAEQFAKCVTGSVVECDVDYGPLEKIGLVHEHKTERVDLNISVYDIDFRTRLQIAIKSFEVDGWVAQIHERPNHHRFYNGKYAVDFDRWVESEVV